MIKDDHIFMTPLPIEDHQMDGEWCHENMGIVFSMESCITHPQELEITIIGRSPFAGAAMEKFDSRAQAAYVAALFCGVECLMSGRVSGSFFEGRVS